MREGDDKEGEELYNLIFAIVVIGVMTLYKMFVN